MRSVCLHKSPNCLVDANGRCKVADFGVADMAQSDIQQQFRLRLSSGAALADLALGADAQSEAGELLRPPTASCGNPRWLAPELCGGTLDDGGAPTAEAERLDRLFGADSWALGVIGWELLTLRDPLDDFRAQADIPRVSYWAALVAAQVSENGLRLRLPAAAAASDDEGAGGGDDAGSAAADHSGSSSSGRGSVGRPPAVLAEVVRALWQEAAEARLPVRAAAERLSAAVQELAKAEKAQRVVAVGGSPSPGRAGGGGGGGRAAAAGQRAAGQRATVGAASSPTVAGSPSAAAPGAERRTVQLGGALGGSMPGLGGGGSKPFGGGAMPWNSGGRKTAEQ
eukprot:SAG22_NODE_110_length_19679_cov_45.046527_18_plen_340_part_00